ncbi:fatty acid synthase alpha subunit Lsd1, partial [Linderina pennispora]
MPVDGVIPLSSQVMTDTAGVSPADNISPSLVHDVRVIKDLDQLVFSHPVDMHAGLLTTHREQITKLLCSYSARPWFGINADGGAVELQDMTYMEVIDRLVELMYTRHQSQWLDFSHRNLVGRFLRRVEDRFAESVNMRIFQRYGHIDDPAEAVEELAYVYPDIKLTLCCAEDSDYLVEICKRAGTRPVPFIPALDEDLWVWIMNEDDSAVGSSSFAGDSESWAKFVRGRQALGLNTEMAWAHAQEMANSIKAVLIDQIIQSQYDGDISSVPCVEYISPDVAPAPPASSVTSAINPSELTYVLPAEKAQLPSADSWLGTLAGTEKSWLSALLTAPDIIRGTRCARNAVQRILRPLPGHSVKVTLDNGFPSRLEVFDPQGMTDVSISIDKSRAITATIFHRIFENTFELELVYRYEPTLPISPIVEIGDGRLERIQSIILAALKLGADIPDIEAVDVSLDAVPVKCEPYAVTEGLVRRLCNSVPNMSDSYMRHSDGTQLAPMDVLFYATWPGFAAIQMSPALYDGALDNIHLYNKFSLSEGAQLLHVGDIVDSDIRVTSLENTPIGRKVTLVSRLFRDGTQFATVESAVLSRDVFADYSRTFKVVDEPASRVTLVTAEDVAVLRSKEWFVFLKSPEDEPLSAGQTLEFSLKSVYRYKSDRLFSSIQTTGAVYVVEADGLRCHVADIDYMNRDIAGNPVTEYLKQAATHVEDTALFDHEGFPICMEDSTCNSAVDAPSDNWRYAHVSGDYNIIHTNPYVANYVGLPGQICHGMWTSASTRAHVERFAANGDPNRVRSYQADFVGMVLPGDQLNTKLLHVGMKRGLMLVAGKTFNQGGDLVLTCTAEVEQPKSAYIFTGQGAQFAGMGMDLYNSSAVARNVWNRADTHMRAKYGVSLLEIVRGNPKQLLVKFSGKKGSQIRTNYLSLTRTFAGKTTQLVPGITGRSPHYIHKSANGLLNATLFTQPIQTVMSLAQIADMRAHGVVQEDAQFAGHSLGEIG